MAFWRHFGALGVPLGHTLATTSMQNHITTLHKNMLSGTADSQFRGSFAVQNGDETDKKQRAQASDTCPTPCVRGPLEDLQQQYQIHLQAIIGLGVWI